MKGKVQTALGPVEPGSLGKVLMHEHIYADMFDWENSTVLREERTVPEYRDLIFREGIPFLKQCSGHGCHTIVDAGIPSWRALPDFYIELSKKADINIVLCTGFYREVELNTYFVKREEDAIWPVVRESSIKELEEMCVREVTEGIHGTEVQAGVIKVSSSGDIITPVEEKAIRAGARAQKKTGVHITTHCTSRPGTFEQLRIFKEEGVDPSRISIGHIGWAFGDDDFRKQCIPWFTQGVSFLITNMVIGKDKGEKWRSCIHGIHDLFDRGFGTQLGFGLDSGYMNTYSPKFKAEGLPSWAHMFTHTLPAFREMGLTQEEEQTILVETPKKLLPVV